LCDHPLSDITIAGTAVDPLPEVFHTLLQTIADAMMFLPWGSALQVSPMNEQLYRYMIQLFICFLFKKYSLKTKDISIHSVTGKIDDYLFPPLVSKKRILILVNRRKLKK
jgi:hypothetical protein